MVSQVAPTLSAPLVLFTYYNPIIRRGMDKFCQQIKAAGAAGGCTKSTAMEPGPPTSTLCVQQQLLVHWTPETRCRKRPESSKQWSAHMFPSTL
jgi:tryptophan synthase alpha chain